MGAATNKIRIAKTGKAGKHWKQLVKLWRCAHRLKKKLEKSILKLFFLKMFLENEPQEFLASEIKCQIVM